MTTDPTIRSMAEVMIARRLDGLDTGPGDLLSQFTAPQILHFMCDAEALAQRLWPDRSNP